jgi:hypothetical protein
MTFVDARGMASVVHQYRIPLVFLGPLPDWKTAEEERLKKYESLLSSGTPPISDAEARSLVHLVGQTSAQAINIERERTGARQLYP